MNFITRDLSYVLRTLRRTPLFSGVAITTLAVGLSANATLFSLVNGVLLKNYGIPHFERLATLTRVYQATGDPWNGVSDEELAAVEANRRAAGIAALVIHDQLTAIVTLQGTSEKLSGELVTGNYFEVLGVRPKLGRTFVRADTIAADSSTVPVIISERLWRRLFDASPSAIGASVTVGGVGAEVVGVAPDSFRGTWVPNILTADIWVPVGAALRVAADSTQRLHRMLITLESTATLQSANAAVAAIGAPLFRDPDAPRMRLAVLPAANGIIPRQFDTVGIQIAIAGVVLSGVVFLITCANLTNLFLARADARAGALAVRLALGASRRDIRRLVLSEIAVLTAAAGIVGALVTTATAHLMNQTYLLSLEGISIRVDLSTDVRVFLYLLTLVTAAATAIGILCVRQLTRRPLEAAVIGRGNGVATAPSARAQTRLAAIQIGLSTALLVVAALFVRSAGASFESELLYDTSRLVVASVDIGLQGLDVSHLRARQLDEQLSSVRARSDVFQGAAVISGLPGVTPLPYVRVSADSTSASRVAELVRVSPGAFDTLGLSLVVGRDFASTDPDDAQEVVVDETIAGALWPAQDPVGQRVVVEAVSLQVRGVVRAATRGRSFGSQAGFIYRPLWHDPVSKFSLIAATRHDPRSTMTLLPRLLRSGDASIAAFDIKTGADAEGFRYTPVRVAAKILATSM